GTGPAAVKRGGKRARLADGHRASDGNADRSRDRLRARQPLRDASGVPGCLRPPRLRRRRAPDDAQRRRSPGEADGGGRTDRGDRRKAGGRRKGRSARSVHDWDRRLRGAPRRVRGSMATAGPETEPGGLNIHPMDQFLLQPLFGEELHWFTPTNGTLWMLLTVAAASLLMVAGTRGRALVPSRSQSAAEMTYGFIRKMVEDVTGRAGAKYFPYIMTIFLFILFANVLALIPTSFSPTSHIAVTATLGIGVFLTVTAI